MNASRFDATERLAKRVLNGEVIFFVGSGFSIDSEGNDAARLVGRLLAGLLALGTVLTEEAGDGPAAASDLLDGLGRVFSLAGAERAGAAAREPARCMTDANLKLLAREYYNFNDWATSAFGVLAGDLLELKEPRCSEVARAAQKLGTFLLGLVGDRDALDAIDCRALRGFGEDAAARGKALFLDTMGFANDAIMAGTPLDPNIEQVARSYRGRIRPRHHAIARLAREGLAPATVTTNYDLLLEGAFRLAGFVERESANPIDGTPSDTLARFSRIAGADQFFASGQGYRSALLLKIHGCAQAYRDVRQLRLTALEEAATETRAPATDQLDPWAAYLPSLVFTYREIQTWRADAWSRDLIRTLLRTYTIALCGYSGADPVMHSTFREVYEEKAQSRLRAARETEHDNGDSPPGASPAEPPATGQTADAAVPSDSSAAKASVFFFGLAGRREFHSLEILRAATAAAGFRTGKLADHPNHIEFERMDGFPTLDDHFRWLSHTVVRELQYDAVTTRLRRLLPRLLRLQQPCRDRDLQQLYDRFAELRRGEQEVIATLYPVVDPLAHRPPDGDGDAAFKTVERRREFERIVGWTWHFVPGLLREFALADKVEAYQGAGRALRTERTPAFYHPISSHPEWAAWAVVIELALRSLVAALHDRDPLLPAGLAAEESPHAAISFGSASGWLPLALSIRMAGFERPNAGSGLLGVFRRTTHWELREQDVPWPLETHECRCPSAAAMWRWARGNLPTRAEAVQHLGAHDDEQQPRQ